MIYSSCSLGWKDGLQMQHTATFAQIHTTFFPHSLKAPQCVAQFISPSHLYTLAYRTVTSLLHTTIQNSWQQPHLSLWLITINMWLWPPQNFFPIYILISSRFNRSYMIMDYAATPFSLIWLTDCHSTSLVFSLKALSSLLSSSLFPPPHPSPGLSLYSFSDDDDGNDCDEASCAMVPLSHQMKAQFSQPSLSSSCLHFRDDVTDERSTESPLVLQEI